ncbi:MAG: InlB B-repeat-containing protein, partial [Christensenellaceae bacterium]|nr:InlB B-repeat-containing protein [Christensenellaceae bacterium]
VAHDITKAPTAEGFKFWGWFEDEALTQAAKSSYSLTDNLNLYAKWTEAVTLTFDYNGQGTEAVVVADKYVGDKVSGIPAVAADVKFGEKVFAGWFVKHDDGSFGEEASTSTVLEGDTTYYAKWVDAPQSYGTYKGWNLFGTKSSKTENTFSREVLVVNANGTYKYGSKSGTLTDEQAAITDGAMVLDETYYYFNKELGLMWRKYNGGKADGVGTDTDLGVDISKVSSVAYTGRSDVGSSYVAYLVITYKDETTKTAFLYNSIIVANATLEGAEATNITGKDFTVKVNGVTIAKVVGKTVLENDGLAGTYTGDYGEIIVDGYGNVTVGGVAVDYTVIAERTIKFVAANSMKEVIVDLGNGTYAKVLDGYQGTYTLPDNSTITLDGFGGAGDGKTYVVNGSNVTIFDGETSTTYGIDVANKQFLGKSLLAGCVFTGKTIDNSLTITFDDAVDYTGTILIGTTSAGLTLKFTATFDGTTLVITIVKENSVSYNNGKTWTTDSYYGEKVTTMVLSGNKLTVTETQITSFYPLTGGVATCEGFSL